MIDFLHTSLVRYLLLCVGLFVWAGSSVMAQETNTSASSVTDQNFAPKLQNLDGAIVFSGATGTQAPPGSEQIGITLSGVDLKDGLPQMGDANAALRQRLTNGRVPVSELFDAVAALEEAYANAGFVLARVVLPQQSLRDGGVLKVVVVTGFIETVDTATVPPELRRRLDQLTDPLLDRTELTLAELERQLLLAGDTAGVSLGTALGAGQRPGGTVLTLDPEYQKITAFVGFGNNVADDLGGFSLNSGVEFNSPFGYGETLYARVSGSPTNFTSSDPRYRVLSGGFVLPLGVSGLVVNGEFTTSDTTPDNAQAPTRSNFDRQSLRFIYPLIRSRQLNVSTRFSIDRQQDSQDFVRSGSLSPIYEDKITVLRFGGSLNYLHENGGFSDVGLVLSRGVDGLGARTASDAVVGGVGLSRDGADATFTKLNLSGLHQRALSDTILLSLTARAQLSFGDALVTSERFGLSGPRELSGFDSGALRGDSGWLVRAEVAQQLPVTLGNFPVNLNPYAFVSAGGVSNERPTAVESARESARSFGIGIDIITKQNSRFRAGTMRLELARGERNHGSDQTRFSISSNFRF